jgi:putative phosphoesterase
MMKLAVITDVHADVHALRDALEQIDALKITQIVCCGDLLDYGLFPEQALTLLRERQIIAIRGNHDRWAIKAGGDTNGWDLTPTSIAYLESLPTSWRTEALGMRVLLAHARPGSDMRGIAANEDEHELAAMLDAAEADVLIVGHTHVPFVRRLSDGRIVANPGALLRDPAPGYDVGTPGTFGVLDLAARKFSVRRARDGSVLPRRADGTFVT